MHRLGAFVGAIKAHKGKKAVGKALSVSVLNQAVSSATNFALGIYLVRMLSPAEFGLYGIGFAISLFYAGIGNALFLTQMVVHTPDKSPEDRLPYAGRMFVLVTVFCICTIVLLAAVLLLCGNKLDPISHHAGLATAITAASIAYLAKDFFVRHAYNVRRETWALSIHGVIAAAMACLLVMQYKSTTTFSVEIAMWVYAVAQACGSLLGYLFARLPVARHRPAELYADLREAWLGGKWSSITNLVYFARTQAHTIVVAALLGPIGVAKLNAARLLVTPVVMLSPALAQVAMPRLAAARGLDERRLMHLGCMFTLALLAVALLYSALLLGSYDFISNKVLGDHYHDLFLLTALWCLWAMLSAINNGIALISQVLKQFKAISHANTITAILSLCVVYVFSINYGLPGAMAGVLLSEAILMIVLFYVLRIGGGSV